MDDELDEFLSNLMEDTDGQADLSQFAEYSADEDVLDYENEGDLDVSAYVQDAEDNLPEDIKSGLDTLAFLDSYNKVKTASLYNQSFDDENAEYAYDDEEDLIDESELYEEAEVLAEQYLSEMLMSKSASMHTDQELEEAAFQMAMEDLVEYYGLEAVEADEYENA